MYLTERLFANLRRNQVRIIRLFFKKVNSKTPFYNKKMFLKEEPAFLSQLRLRDFQSPESSLSPNPSLQVPVVIRVKSNLWQF